MAQRFGGKFSPSSNETSKPAKSGFQNARPSRAGGRVNALFVVPLLLIWPAFTSGPVLMAFKLAALGVLLLAAWLTREGLLAQEAYEARKVARRPAIPRKMFGSALTGLGLALAGFSPDSLLMAPVIFAVLGAALHFCAFGPDPLKHKSAEGIDEFQTDRVARAVDEAEKHLSAMTDAIKRVRDRRLETRVTEFQTTARDLFRTVEDDPRDLTAARKYLSVYLRGARDATTKFADFYTRQPNPQARTDYETLLTDLEQNFASRTDALLRDNATDLTVEIEVLRERLQREGISRSATEQGDT